MEIFLAIVGIFGILIILALIGYAFKIIFSVIRLVFTFLTNGIGHFLGCSVYIYLIVLLILALVL